MKKFQWPLRAFLFIALFQILSCTKTADQSSPGSVSLTTSDNLTFPTTNEFSTCKLRRIYQSYGTGSPTVAGQFTYNGAGNPVSVLFDASFADQHYFSYDKLGRLKEYKVESEFGDFRHRYGYDAHNTIITDTFISNPGTYERINISTFTYDTQGRIAKENIRNIKNAGQPLEPTRNPTFTYDSRGNLAVAGWKSSSYDYKVSIFRSHPVFQFIHRNYSRNNSSAQTQYNSKGLPLTVLPGNDNFFNQYNVTKAVYDCQ